MSERVKRERERRIVPPTNRNKLPYLVLQDGSIGVTSSAVGMRETPPTAFAGWVGGSPTRLPIWASVTRIDSEHGVYRLLPADIGLLCCVQGGKRESPPPLET